MDQNHFLRAATMPDQTLDDHSVSLLRKAVREEVSEPMAELRRFVDRRIAELSMEIHATVQLVDYSEVNLSGQLARIHEQIASVITAPTLAARNSGVELEAVVLATEEAANRIMEAAEAIESWINQDHPGSDGRMVVNAKIAAIFEACSFQDLTSQRIRRAIEHLQGVETMLGKLIPEGTTALPMPDITLRAGIEVKADAQANPDMGQAAIDALMDF